MSLAGQGNYCLDFLTERSRRDYNRAAKGVAYQHKFGVACGLQERNPRQRIHYALRQCVRKAIIYSQRRYVVFQFLG